MILISQHIEQIKQLCRYYNVKHLFVFGSVLNNNFNEHSDIDLLVSINETDPVKYSDNYFLLKSELEKILKRKIDLLEEKSIKNPYLLQQINQTKVILYGNEY